MADDKAEEAGLPPANKIERKPVGSAATSSADADPSAPVPASASASASASAPEEPPPYSAAGGSRDDVQAGGDTKTPFPDLSDSSRPEEQGAGAPAPAPATTAGATGSTFRERTPPMSIDVDHTKPEDFEGEIDTTNELPSLEHIKKLDDFVVLDKHGKSHTFKSLHSGANVARRVLIIFVRHFFCGNCQEYLRMLSDTITPESLLKLPVSTVIAVIGCGDPSLIDFYAQETGCQFPIYTDPQRSLFKELGMTQTWEMGAKPTYMRRSMGYSVFASIAQGLKSIPMGKAHKSGNFKQVGGEFLFEPSDMVTPVTTPQDERPSIKGRSQQHAGGEDEPREPIETKRVTWCHRMRTSRDHVEMPELMEILGMEEKPTDQKDQEKWDQSLRTRKGTGSSMARQMSELSHATG